MKIERFRPCAIYPHSLKSLAIPKGSAVNSLSNSKQHDHE